MKANEAIIELKDIKKQYIGGTEECSIIAESIDIGIEALEKQIAKPVKGKSVTHEGYVANCPFCNKFIRFAENKVYCDCGQKVEW